VRDVLALAEKRLVERVLERSQPALVAGPEAGSQDQRRARLVARQVDLDPALERPPVHVLRPVDAQMVAARPEGRPRRRAALGGAAVRTGAHVCCGLVERDGDRLHKTAVLVSPDGLIGAYRKTHLPFLGVDRFVVPGDELPVWDTPLGRIGVEICYDLRFPEVTRTLALNGADIVCHPTNFPVAAQIQTEL